MSDTPKIGDALVDRLRGKRRIAAPPPKPKTDEERERDRRASEANRVSAGVIGVRG